MSSAGAAPRAAVPVSNARAEASRKNGARSRGPETLEGKARSARNALKHGLRAQKHAVLPDEVVAAFKALEAALTEELAPESALQSILVGRIARAVWRLERAEQLEVELFEWRRRLGGGIGVALIRDGNGTRSFETILRYRGAAQAELTRALRTLKALQAEQKAMPRPAAEPEPAPVLVFEPRRGRAGAVVEIAPHHGAAEVEPRGYPIGPEARPDAESSAPQARAASGREHPLAAPAPARPNEPGRTHPAGPARARLKQPDRRFAGLAHARPSEPELVPAVVLARSERDLDEARLARRGDMRPPRGRGAGG
jgi:hypothetical protein